MGWKEKRLAGGWQMKTTWLDPKALDALAGLKLTNPDMTEAEIVARALLHLAKDPTATMPVNDDGLAKRVAALEAKLDGLQPPQPRAVSAPRDPAGHQAIIAACAAHFVKAGHSWTFNHRRLWDELTTQGLPVNNRPNNFTSWVGKHRAEIEAHARTLPQPAPQVEVQVKKNAQLPLF